MLVGASAVRNSFGKVKQWDFSLGSSIYDFVLILATDEGFHLAIASNAVKLHHHHIWQHTPLALCSVNIIMEYRPWTQQDLSLLYNLRVSHPNLPWYKITEMYQDKAFAIWSRNTLSAKWAFLNRQKVIPPLGVDTAIVAITQVACNTMTKVFQKSQKATEPWDGIAADSLNQGNPLETDLWQGRELAISSELVSGYLANPGEQGPNFSLPSNACGNHEF